MLYRIYIYRKFMDIIYIYYTILINTIYMYKL